MDKQGRCGWKNEVNVSRFGDWHFHVLTMVILHLTGWDLWEWMELLRQWGVFNCPIGGEQAAELSGCHGEIVFVWCENWSCRWKCTVLMAQRYFLMLPCQRCNVETTIRNGEGGQLWITNGCWFHGYGSITNLGREGWWSIRKLGGNWHSLVSKVGVELIDIFWIFQNNFCLSAGFCTP